MIALVDLGLRSLYLDAHYTDLGVLPEALRASLEDPLHWDLHALAPGPPWQWLLFAAAAAAALALALGKRPALAAAALWVLTTSLQNHNELVDNKGDQILRLLLFWCMLLPFGRLAEAGLLVQTALVWLVSAAAKTGVDWFPDGTALAHTLALDFAAAPLGVWARQFPGVLRLLTYMALALEWLGPVLLFVPWRRGRLRQVAIVGLAGMHLGIAATMEIGIFPYLSLCSLLPFVPATWWDRVTRRGDAGGVGTRRPARPLAATLPGSALALTCFVNAASMARLALPPGIGETVRALRLDQDWTMYAPYPSRLDGWFEATVTVPDGRRIDAFSGKEALPAGVPPPLISATFPTERWRRYLMTLIKPDDAAYRPAFAAYLCRRYPEAERAELVFDRRDVTVDGSPRRLQRMTVASRPCR